MLLLYLLNIDSYNLVNYLRHCFIVLILILWSTLILRLICLEFLKLSAVGVRDSGRYLLVIISHLL